MNNTAKVKQLKKLLLIDCRKFERFEGDNSGVTWMVIDGCKNLDLITIKTFSNIESVCINTNNREVALSDFCGLNKLRNLSLIRCKVNVDIVDLKETMPNLKKLYISNINKEQLKEITYLNPNISFTF